MTWLRKLRPALFVLGGLLLVGSLLGARLLATGTTNDPPKSSSAASSMAGTGPVVIGFVDSDPSPVPYGLPPVLQSGLIASIAVREGQSVKAGDELFTFDTTVQLADVKRADALVAKAKAEEAKAQGALKAHEQAVSLQKLAVETATFKKKTATEVYDTYEKTLRQYFIKQQGWEKLPVLSADQQKTIDDQMSADPKRLELQRTRDVAGEELKFEEAKLREVISARETRIDPLIAEANAGMAQADAEVKKAKDVLALCTVRARTAGVVEQINVSPGTVLGISTRIPALWLIPDGPRIVRAEVEAEFAHRVTPQMYGRQVTIHDHNDAKLTYRGTFKRISDSFLPKRSGGDSLLGNETKVLEAFVEISEPIPPGVPPLRIGQKVKVNFGQ